MAELVSVEAWWCRCEFTAKSRSEVDKGIDAWFFYRFGFGFGFELVFLTIAKCLPLEVFRLMLDVGLRAYRD